MTPPCILVHGGAGPWRRVPERLAEARAACVDAAAAGQAVLLAGGTAVDAVEAAVRILEDCPALDAGRGSYPTRSGGIEMDAMVMDGADLGLGAVAAVGGIRHPVSLARSVMERSGHSLLVGPGAEAFADAVGFPRCADAELRVDRPPVADAPAAGPQGDTVGAVALDRRGHLAAATSTGGTAGKLPGRVGDSPLAGAGGYADDRSAAVSSTGQGEALMKLVLAKHAADLAAAGRDAQAACEAAVALLGDRLGAPGGLIAIDTAGRLGMACNTEAMPVAWAHGSEPVRSRTFLDEAPPA